MRFQPQAAFAACALAAALLLGGCHKSDKTSLAFVTNNASDYWTICQKGVAKAQKELPNDNVVFKKPGDGTVATQQQYVNDLIATGVSGIAISPVDPTNETPFLDQVASKTNLITSDSDAPNSKRLCYIGTDNHAAGMKVGGLIKQAIPQGGQIMLFVGQADAQNAKDRMQGIRDALKGSNIQILDVRTDGTDHAVAKSNAADTLVKYPHIAGLVGIWSYNGPAIVSAVQDAGKVGKVKIVCFDQEQGTIDGLKSGAIYGAVVQDPYTFGYKSIKLLDQLAHGDKSGLPASGQIFIPTQIITPANVNQYEAQQAKLMGGG
jgi:ribose transport system substrate-binding protein